MSREVVIVAYGRSAVCKSRKGSFAGTHPIEYSAQVLKGVLDKVPQLDRSEIEDVIMGCAVQHGTTSMNIAKSVCARAELPECVAGHTINRFCSSGLQAIATGANAIACGQGDVIVAGGVESMTDTYAPYPVEFQDAWLNEHAPGAYMSMGITAENIVKNYGVTREEMDRMAYESNMKAAKAQKEGKLAPSIIPVTVVDKDGNEKVVTEDEGIRPTTTMETLAGLKPCFIPAEEGGTVTAATSSQTSDASAFVVLMAADKAKELGIKPIAKMVSFGVAGCDATMMGLGPIYAVPKALKRAGKTIDDMDVIELNEAFAAQDGAVGNDLGLDPEKLNVNGGAIALGHPIGASGCRILVSLLYEMERRDSKYGLATLCIGGGMGTAMVVERV